MRDAALIRHFLRRFADHDYLPSSAGRREMLAMAAGMLTGVSVCLSLLVSIKYQFNTDMPPGLTSLSFLGDCSSFVSTSMFLLALLAVTQWDALALDSRDVAVLGVLPVSRRRLIHAKLVAVGGLAFAVGFAWNVPGILLRPMAVPIHLPVGARGIVVLTVAHAIVTLAAGAFGFLSIFAVREGMTMMLGRRGFRSVSPTLQALLLVIVSVGLLLIPATTRNVARDWFAPHATMARWYPPAWFVGAHEHVVGEVVDGLPRVIPSYGAAAERRATDLYRSGRESYRRASHVAMRALAIVAAVCLLSAAWNGRRLPEPDAEQPSGRWTSRSTWKHVASGWRLRSGGEHAGFSFTAQALSRSAPHRMTLATWLGVGLSVIVVSVGDRVLLAHVDVSTVPTALLAAQPVLLGTLLVGLWRASAIAADVRASLTVTLAAPANQRSFVIGVRKAAGVAVVVPVVGVLFPWHMWSVGLNTALMHAVVGMAAGALLIAVLLRYPSGFPFVGGFAEAISPSRAALSVAGVLAFSWGLATAERLALGSVSRSAALIGALVVATMVVLRWPQRTAPLAMTLDLDAAPDHWTQRLDLSG